MMRRLAAAAFLLAFLAIPSEAGLFHRKPKTPRQTKAKYGLTREAHQKQVNKGRSRTQRRLNPVAVRGTQSQ